MALMGSLVITPAVHPHGRGDNDSCGSERAEGHGSPPRAWGQFAVLACDLTARRFTPTGVGTIAAYTLIWSTYSVHPHGRGDNDTLYQRASASVGSPPRAWGQSRHLSTWGASARFTPTGVGTIGGDHQRHTEHTVHPHGRGDNSPSDV